MPGEVSRSYEGPADAIERLEAIIEKNPLQANFIRTVFHLGVEAAREKILATPETWRGDGKYDNSWSAARQNAIIAIETLL